MEICAPDVAAMRAIGASLARALLATETPFVVALHGELGAGKTTLVGALLHAFGFPGHVRSPTYTLIEPYELAGRFVYHLDLYRLVDTNEVEPLGLRELQTPNSIFLIEWPERGEGALPPIDLAVFIRYEVSAGRRLTIEARSKNGQDALLALTAAAKP